VEAFPLNWPAGTPRTAFRSSSKFKPNGFGRARDEVIRQVRLLGGTEMIFSTNVRLRGDGVPLANQADVLPDPGVAIYFRHPTRGQLCFACDRYPKVSENAYAIAKTLDAIRGIARWGTAEFVDRAFTGFRALPLAGTTEDGAKSWWVVLGVRRDARVDVVNERARELLAEFHPDKPGGDRARYDEVGEARDQFRAERNL
jgi:hypothetical protein